MKVAIAKIGARITVANTGTAASTGETLALIDMLINSGVEVDAYTKVRKKDIMPNDFRIYNIDDEYTNINDRGYDALLVLNGNGNFFGGVEDTGITLTYNIINNFNGPVFYIISDLSCNLKQIWANVSSKPWGSKYKKEDIFITRNDIKIIAQANDLVALREFLSKDKINYGDIYHFPIEKYSLYTNDNYDKLIKTCDIMYGGSFRQGKREKDMVKFYFGYDNLDVIMFGNIKLDNFNHKLYGNLKPPIFQPPVKYSAFIPTMASAISTVIISDNQYKKTDMLTLRIYESIQAGVVTLIDSSFDVNRRIFSDSYLNEFCYVKDRKDVMEKIEYIKANKMARKLVQAQRKAVAIDKTEYALGFRHVIEDHI